MVNLFHIGEPVPNRLFLQSTIIIILSILMTGIGISEADFPGIEEKVRETSVLSSDLLQLLDDRFCPPGQSPDDIIRGMEQNGQVRWDGDDTWLVHITLELEKEKPPSDILPYLTDYSEDYAYHLITGWVTAANLTVLNNMRGIKRIKPVFPPVRSGFLEVVSNDTPPQDINDSSWKTKLSTDLLQLLDETYLSPGQSRADIMELMEQTGEIRNSGEEVEIRISARTNHYTSPESFRDYFSEPAQDNEYGRIGGWIRGSDISRLAMEKGITSLMVQIPPRTSEIRTEGDYLLDTKDYREKHRFSGEGITVGVISDGVDGLDRMISAGELPQVEVLSDTIGGDEGTAMLQIIHDIAPNATLVFHDRGSSQIEYVRALDELIIHGCRIICDDITYVEPFFEDGYISQNIIDRIISYHILVITAAGNFAQEHYQAPFSGYENQGYLWQEFNSSKGRDMHFSVSPGVAGHVILQWDDRFGSSSNNYDLFLYDESGREIARSVNLQDGDDDPMEWVRFVNSYDTPREYTVRVVQAAADDAMLEIYILPLSGRSIIVDPNTPGDSVFGQQAMTNALTIGAAAPDPENITVQSYSSRGPVSIKYPNQEKREKPDIVGPDHITVLTGAMQQAVFTGTSAAAPHIAGLAALIWSANPSLQDEEVRNIILDAARGTPPVHNWSPDTGYGMPSAENLTEELNGTNQTPLYPLSMICNYTPREYDQAGNITLYPGWNMISVPYPIKEGNNTGIIFGSVQTRAHTIWRYETGNRTWIPIDARDTLRQMDVVWVFSSAIDTLNLPLDDSGLNQTSITLNPGWNPVGVPGKESITAKELLSPLKDSWTTVLVYDPKTQSYRPSIINEGTGTYSPERLLYPTEGWWIYMNRQGILFPVS